MLEVCNSCNKLYRNFFVCDPLLSNILVTLLPQKFVAVSNNADAKLLIKMFGYFLVGFECSCLVGPVGLVYKVGRIT